eukprot:13275-Amphidinium_carterae.1
MDSCLRLLLRAPGLTRELSAATLGQQTSVLDPAKREKNPKDFFAGCQSTKQALPSLTRGDADGETG